MTRVRCLGGNLGWEGQETVDRDRRWPSVPGDLSNWEGDFKIQTSRSAQVRESAIRGTTACTKTPSGRGGNWDFQRSISDAEQGSPFRNSRHDLPPIQSSGRVNTSVRRDRVSWLFGTTSAGVGCQPLRHNALSCASHFAFIRSELKSFSPSSQKEQKRNGYTNSRTPKRLPRRGAHV